MTSLFLKKTLARPAMAFALALLVIVMAGCGSEHSLPTGPASQFLTQGWVKTDRGFAWCLFSSVHGGSSADCDWSTLTDVEPEKYTDITK